MDVIVWIAIAAAVAGSVANAYAAVFQHDAVDATIDTVGDRHQRFVGWRRLLRLVRSPQWVTGMVLVGIGAAFHTVGLTLAPITIIQPVGILAIIFAIVIASRRRSTTPRARGPGFAVWCSAVVTVLGLTIFVVLAATHTAPTERINGYEVANTAVLLAAFVVALCLLGVLGPQKFRCLAWATACAICFGFASALLRALTMLIRSDTPTQSPLMIMVIAGLLVAYLAGGWMAQQAYASGPAEVVISTLTVFDPLVAVGIGWIVLGEGDAISLPLTAAMLMAAAVAAGGVLSIAKHHPQATPTYR